MATSNELASKLDQRRRAIDERGTQFVKVPNSVSTADVAWSDVHQSQFTPRGYVKPPPVADAEEAQELLISEEQVADLPPLDQLEDAVADSASVAQPAAHASAAGADEVVEEQEEPEEQPEEQEAPGKPSELCDTAPEAQEDIQAEAPAVYDEEVPEPVPVDAAPTMPVLPPSQVDTVSVLPSTEQPSKEPVMAKEVLVSRDPRVWHAVVQGDIVTLEHLVEDGTVTSGRILDQHSHSIFWNAVAFQRVDIAHWLLKRFPPDAESKAGIDLAEVHSRRQDSLLHLCLYIQDFNAKAAKLFELILRGRYGSNLANTSHINSAGQTFMHIAASRLNFWVLRFALSTVEPAQMSRLLAFRDPAGNRPLDILVLRLQDALGVPARPPAPVPPPVEATRLPQWCSFAAFVPKGPQKNDAEDAVFSDVHIEVQDPTFDGGVVRLPAHRAVLGANSSKLHQHLKSEGGNSLRLDPSCCRSWEVAVVALNFLYSGEVANSFPSDPRHLGQLLSFCKRYDLPTPFTSFAKAALLHSVYAADSKSAAAMSDSLQHVASMELSSDERWLLAFVYLSRSNRFEDADIEGLLSALAISEEMLLAARKVALAAAGTAEQVTFVAEPPAGGQHIAQVADRPAASYEGAVAVA
mmetsp:Transcript_37491/g.86490  ORF Transcript_37491/g.86490 Transcript_37491/m.86490 type:complete len:637 (-) Transcript_37491:29-1939(-)